MRQRLAILQAPDAGRAEILDVFRTLAREAAGDRERKGCLVTNCSIELADRDPDLAYQAARSLDLLERAFADAARRAQARGEIAATRDPIRLARFLAVCMEGMLVLARIRPDAAWLDDAVGAIDEALH
jgi:TetR/AcrR family transcriptional repressor of nem operon